MNFLGGGITTFDFIVSILVSENGRKLTRSFITSTVRVLEFRTPSISVVSVRGDSLFQALAMCP